MLPAFAAVAGHFGADTTAEDIARQYVLGEAGISDSALVAIASDLGLEAKWITLRSSQLGRLARVLPAVLRLRDGGALVLESVRVDEASGLVAMVSDPAGGGVRAALGETQLAELWDGQVLLVKRSARADDSDQPFGFAWLLKQFFREKIIFRDVFIAAFISTIFTLTPPFVIMVVLDRVLVNHSVQTLIVISVALLTMIGFEMLLSFQKRKFMTMAATRIDGRLQIFVMERLLRLPMDYFDTTPVGRTSTRLHKMTQIRHFMTGELFQTLLSMTTLFGLIPCLFILEWRLAFWVIALAGIIFIIVYVFLAPLERRYKDVVQTETIKGIYMIESLQGMRTIKSLALEGRRRLGWDERVAAGLDARQAWESLANRPRDSGDPLRKADLFRVGPDRLRHPAAGHRRNPNESGRSDRFRDARGSNGGAACAVRQAFGQPWGDPRRHRRSRQCDECPPRNHPRRKRPSPEISGRDHVRPGEVPLHDRSSASFG